jgi:pyruvate formate lyase activating enzyme
MKSEARYWELIKNNKVHCFLCPHNCVIENGDYGKCKVRKNEGGTLFTINYGHITSLAMDPIEKKPLYYFKPGTYIMSAGTFGCNMSCSFCQNHSISQERVRSRYVSADDLVNIILAEEDNVGIAFTYNEPSIWYEYVYDCAKLLKKKDNNKVVVLVTNGFINKQPLLDLLPYVDAMNIDLKSFSNEFYVNMCAARLNPVLENIKTASEKCHVEVTTLLVTGQNDNINEVEEISKYLANVNKNIPLHLSRYFPRFHMDAPPTDIEFMYKAKSVAEKYLMHVNLGNV